MSQPAPGTDATAPSTSDAGSSAGTTLHGVDDEASHVIGSKTGPAAHPGGTRTMNGVSPRRGNRPESFGLSIAQVAGFGVLIAALLAVLVRFHAYADLIVGAITIVIILVRSIVLGPRPFRVPADPRRTLPGDGPIVLSADVAAHACDAGDAGHCH
jgi:hypothetical protein